MRQALVTSLPRVSYSRLADFVLEVCHFEYFLEYFSSILLKISAMSFLPGTASLIKEIDKRLMVVLRDGRTLIGYLRSIDQFANLLLQDTIERIHVGGKYGDIPRGIFLVRGENMVLVGEIDEEKEANSKLEKVSVATILEAQRDEQLALEEEEKAKTKARLKSGLPVNAPDTYLNSDDVFG